MALVQNEDECFDIQFKWHDTLVHAISHNKVTQDVLRIIPFAKSLITFEVSMNSLTTSSCYLAYIGGLVDFFNVRRDSQSSPFNIELWSKRGKAKSFVKNSNFQKQFCISQKKTNEELLLNPLNFDKWCSYLDTPTKMPHRLNFFISNKFLNIYTNGFNGVFSGIFNMMTQFAINFNRQMICTTNSD